MNKLICFLLNISYSGEKKINLLCSYFNFKTFNAIWTCNSSHSTSQFWKTLSNGSLNMPSWHVSSLYTEQCKFSLVRLSEVSTCQTLSTSLKCTLFSALWHKSPSKFDYLRVHMAFSEGSDFIINFVHTYKWI